MALFPSMSTAQKVKVISELMEMGVDMDMAWERYNSFPGQYSLDLHHMSRRTLVEVLKKHEEKAAVDPQQMPVAIRDCPGAAQIFTVVDDHLHWYRGKSPADYLSGYLHSDDKLILSQLEDGWYAEVRPEAEHPRYIPEIYVTEGKLEASGTVQDILAGLDGSSRAQFLSDFLWSTDMSTVQCVVLGLRQFGIVGEA